MKYNPFQPNRMIAPGMFTGRTDEIRTIAQCLFQTKFDNPQHFLIEGERGIGKSSLLFLVSGFASGDITYGAQDKMDFLTLQVDLAAVTSQHDIAMAIARQLRFALAKRSVLEARLADIWAFLQRFEGMGFKFRSDGSLDKPDDVRDGLVDAIYRTFQSIGSEIDGIFIVIDEADAPLESAGLGEFLKLFTERLTRHGCNRVLLGLSGLPTTIGKLRASHESSPRILEVMRLDPLEPAERRLVVQRGLDDAEQKNKLRVNINDDAMDFLCELSEGYPHFIQQFAYSAFAADNDDVIDFKDVIDGAYKENGALAQLGSKYFNEMYFGRVSSPDYRRVLNAMGPHDDAWIARKTLLAESGVKETTLNNALNALKSKSVIIADDTRQGFYRLPTRSFAAWINAINTIEAKGDVDIVGMFE